jgi:hypothetical protein
LAGLLAVLQLPGQGGFNFTYDNPYGGHWMRFEDVVLSNDTLTVVGTYGDGNLVVAGVIIAQFDTSGTYLQSTVIVDSTSESHLITDPTTQLTLSDNNTYLIPFVNLREHTVNFCELNSSLELVQSSTYTQNERAILPIQIIELQDRLIIYGTIQRQSTYLAPFAIAIDRSGNELWRRYYGINTIGSSFHSAVKVNENQIVIGSGIHGNSSNDTQGLWSKPWIFEIDSLGNVLWEWKGEEHGGYGWTAKNLRRTSDGGWIYTPDMRHLVEVFPTIYESQYTPQLVKRDSAMTLKWTIDYDTGLRNYETFFTDVYVDGLDQVHMAGNRGIFYGEFDALAGRVVKASALFEGEALWEVADTGHWSTSISRSYLAGITVAISGSVFACGRTTATDNTHGWLIKITADGCIDTLCTTTSLTDLIDKDSHKFRIFPNPSRGEFTVEADQQKQGDYVFALYDLYGRLEMHERFDQTATISTSYHAPPGIYVYVIRDAGTGRQLQSGKVMIE